MRQVGADPVSAAAADTDVRYGVNLRLPSGFLRKRTEVLPRPSVAIAPKHASTGDWVGCSFCQSDPIQTSATSQCRDMVHLHFAECSRITEVWSEVDGCRRQHLTQRLGWALPAR